MSSTPSDPDSSAAAEPTREQLVRLIRFSLDELSSTNGYHRFEDLCRHFARERLAPNILPATGPVGVGGDRGRDFETFRTFLREELGPYGAFAAALNEGGAIAFLCTLQRDGVRSKVLADVEKVMSAGPAVAAIYAFLSAPLPKATRDALQDEVRERHGVHLEVLDGLALAEALADHEIFWIAEQFLSIPAAARPTPPETGPDLPDWYVADRDRWRARGRVNSRMGELLDVVDGLRHATSHPEARVDLPLWLELVRGLDRDDVPAEVRQRARYEIAASQLRGLGDLRPADGAARAFLREAVEHEDDPARLQDAATLLTYAGTAVSFGHSDLSPEELSTVNAGLRDRVRAMLADDPPRTRRARLLEVLGLLAVMPDPAAVSRARDGGAAHFPNAAVMIDHGRAEGVPKEAIASLPSADIDEAMRAWAELAGLLDSTPLYPVESWAAMLDFLSPLLLRQPGWEAIEHAVDEALDRARGGNAAAERSRDRALRLLDDGRVRDGLAELHRAAQRWWSGDSLRAALLCMLGISDVYKRLRLPQAAKHYALAAAGAARISSDDDVADLVPHAIMVASEIDYAAGAWASALEHVDIGLMAQAVLVDEEVDTWAGRDLNNAVMTVGMALRAAETLLLELLPAVEEVARRRGMLDDLRRTLADARPWHREEWARLADDQLLGRPFNDVGAERVFRFAALGTRWALRSSSEYCSARAAERLAAAAQILLVELAEDDLCLLPVDLDVEVRLRDGDDDEQRRVQRDTEAPGWHWIVELEPLVPGQPIDEQAHFTEMLGALVELLAGVSLLPARTCLETVTGALERGLGHKLAMGRPFEEMAEVVPAGRYAETPRNLEPPLADGAPAPVEHPELAWQDREGPTYSSEEAREALARRYENLPALVPHTLQRLRAHDGFAEVVAELRSRGWRDWHLLTAVANMVFNNRLARAGLNTVEALQAPGARARVQELTWAPEQPDDPVVAPERFSVAAMDFARRTAVPAYMSGWGLQLPGPVPDMQPVERLLEARYGYWSEDIAHDDPFPGADGKMAA